MSDGGQPLITVFYINRDVDETRRAAVEACLAKTGFVAQRISGVDGRKLPVHLQSLFPASSLKDGEVGCYASHMLAWKEIISRKLGYALILEDDATFEPIAEDVVKSLLANLPIGWDYIHMDGRPRPRSFPARQLATLSNGSRLVRFARIPDGTVAQLVSASGAHKLLREVPRTRPVDVDIRMPWNWDLDTYGVVPSPFQQASLASPIQDLGGHSRTRRWSGSGYRSLSSFVYNFRKLGAYWWLRCSAELATQKISRKLWRRKRPEEAPTHMAGSMDEGAT